MLVSRSSFPIVLGLLAAEPALAQVQPEVRRAVRLEACRIHAEKRIPDRLYDQAITIRRRAALIADCVVQAEAASRKRGGDD
jgi:hypothetical protein